MSEDGGAVTAGGGDSAGAAPEGAGVAPATLESAVVDVLKSTYDPEIPVDIYELGLVYGIDVAADGGVVVRMTLTSPMCPVAGSLPPEVEERIRAIPGVTQARVEVVWDPPWTMDMMSEAAKLHLNLG